MSLPCSQTIRCLSILTPPLLFLILRAMERDVTEMQSDLIAGAIILLWSIGITLWSWRSRQIALSKEYEPALKKTAVEHLVLIALAALLLDGGLTFRASLLAMAIFWMITGIVIARRPDCPKSSDVMFISWGFVILAFLTANVAWVVSSGAAGLLI